ncbi:copper chaperone PCu(A)C [Azospirillum picis]|uniref:Copper(I)-binding protein n=1 Tax=Azospirillum picis TaxID=488438 RepID=A0ABU0MH17_9PROT|nr:copper chaperone PCu(A)C [Azospirillum picis]MBP2299018.1 copper(I)-binding protein [Azospirillum picis]MDQ0532740.1 copper(I)-binding protein [Azospirillum picis]
MKRVLAIATALSMLGAAAALAHSYKAGPIDIGHPWARATAPSAPNGGAYLSLSNTGADGDRLVAASTPAAEKAELHTHLNENGVMKMREVPGIDVLAGETVKLAPSGLHVMLLGLKQPLVKGTRFPMTLRFEKAGSVDVEVAVEGAGETGAGHEAGQMQHGGMDAQGHGAAHGAGNGADKSKMQ